MVKLKCQCWIAIFWSVPKAEGFLGDKAEKLQSVGVSTIHRSFWKWAKWEHQCTAATLKPSLKVSPSSHIDVSGNFFVIVSNRPKQGDLESYKEGVGDYLKKQKFLLIDFLHHGKIFFATLKPTSVVHWSRTLVCQNSEIGEKNGKSNGKSTGDEIGIILDMICPANIHLLKELLANQQILKLFCQNESQKTSKVSFSSIFYGSFVCPRIFFQKPWAMIASCLSFSRCHRRFRTKNETVQRFN